MGSHSRETVNVWLGECNCKTQSSERIPRIESMKPSLSNQDTYREYHHKLSPSPVLMRTTPGREVILKRRIGGKVTLGGIERWFSPRGQDLAFLLSCIGLVRPSSSADLKQKQNKEVI
jgi:hypothetical protein